MQKLDELDEEKKQLDDEHGKKHEKWILIKTFSRSTFGCVAPLAKFVYFSDSQTMCRETCFLNYLAIC